MRRAALAFFGAVLLFLHPHRGGAYNGSLAGMQHGGHAMSKRTVQREHFRFAVSGFGVVLFKFLADGRFSKKRFRPLLWPFCVAFLGILLILYRE